MTEQMTRCSGWQAGCYGVKEKPPFSFVRNTHSSNRRSVRTDALQPLPPPLQTSAAYWYHPPTPAQRSRNGSLSLCVALWHWALVLTSRPPSGPALRGVSLHLLYSCRFYVAASNNHTHVSWEEYVIYHRQGPAQVHLRDKYRKHLKDRVAGVLFYEAFPDICEPPWHQKHVSLLCFQWGAHKSTWNVFILQSNSW